MGNSSSSISSMPRNQRAAMCESDFYRPVTRPPEAVQLDFDNMPFLQPPEEPSRRMSVTESMFPGSPLPPVPSPPLGGSCINQSERQSLVIHNCEFPHVPSGGWLDHTVHDHDFFSTQTISPKEHSTLRDSTEIRLRRSPSSVASQLSVLSQNSPSDGSPNGSPKSHRHSFSERFASGQYERVDAGVPPPVPPHLVFPDYIASKYDSEKETALAAVDALEEDTLPEAGRPPGRARARSLSRSLRRRKSLGSESVTSNMSMTTDVYTRKCSSSMQPSPELISSLMADSSADSEDSLPREPASPDNELDTSTYLLDGYHEGTTQLRVVNLDIDPSELADLHNFEDIPQKYFIKSKAQLAEEEEQRLRASRKRYERYGHKFRGMTII